MFGRAQTRNGVARDTSTRDDACVPTPLVKIGRSDRAPGAQTRKPQRAVLESERLFRVLVFLATRYGDAAEEAADEFVVLRKPYQLTELSRVVVARLIAQTPQPGAASNLVNLRHARARPHVTRRSSLVRTVLDFYQRHLRHRAARRGRPAVAARAGRLAARAAPLGLGFRKLLRLRGHRPVEIFEAELVEAGFVLHHDHPHVAAVLELAEQDLVGERLLDVLLDQARHRPRPHLLVVAVGDQPVAGLVRELDGDVAVAEIG